MPRARYKITAINNSKQHGIGLGEDGRFASIDNLLSQAKRFGLNTHSASTIIDEIKNYTAKWPDHFKRLSNMSDADITRLEGVIPNIV